MKFQLPDGKQFFHFLLTTLILCAPAFYNRYPLVYSDTGTYVGNSFSLVPPVDRAVGYCFFIRIVTWQATLWTIIFAQAMIVNFLILRVLTNLLTDKKDIRFIHLITVVFLTLVTGASWFICQVMPDIFSAILILSFFLFFIEDNLSWYYAFFLATFLVFSISSHFSNIITAWLMIISTAYLIWSQRKKGNEMTFAFKRLFFIILICLSTQLFLASYNYAFIKRFEVSSSSHVYLTARLIESGIMEKYLAEKCKTENYNLCRYKDSLSSVHCSGDFIWVGGWESLMYKTGGWQNSKEDYDKVVWGIMTTPKYFMQFIWKSFESTISQLFNCDIGAGLGAYGIPSPPYYPIYDKIRHEVHEFAASEQQQGHLSFSFINYLNYFFLALSVIALYYFWFYENLSLNQKVFIMIIISGIVFNAAVTGSLANVYSRLQARVAWLLPFTALILLIDFYVKKKRS